MRRRRTKMRKSEAEAMGCLLLVGFMFFTEVGHGMLALLLLGGLCWALVLIFRPSPAKKSPSEKRRREYIPPAVRSEVWRRDGGRCTECGASESLQFDHIIPFSCGGSSTAANLQILCSTCNYRKGARI